MRSPELGARELVALALGATVLAVAMFWPLVLHLGTALPKDLGDPLSQAWQLAWGGHALVEQPGRFFQSNQFWPGRDTLALSDALVGYAPLAVPGDGVTAAVARYDVIFLLASAVAFGGAYLLARELGLSPLAACVAGAAFAYAPWRLEQGGHLHILSSGGIPMSLFLLIRGYRRRSVPTVVSGWTVAAWQVSIGFSLGLPFLVLLAAGGAGIVAQWWHRGRVPLPRPMGAATAVGLLVVVLATVTLALPYLRVRADEPQALRSPRTVATYSAGPGMFLTSSQLNPVWGGASAGRRARLPAVAEQTLFPGVLVMLLALAGATWRSWPRRLRRGLVLAGLALALLSLGFETTGLGRFMPYRALYELVPGWSGIRVPTRLHTFTTLALALLAAAGAARVLTAISGRRVALTAMTSIGLVAGVLAEGAGFGPGRWYPHPVAPPAPAGLAGLADPLLELPVAAADNRRYLLWSTDGFPRLVNGRSSTTPARTTRLFDDVRGFPDARSVRALRRLGVRTVVLHADRLAGTPWAGWRTRPLGGLGLRVRTVGRLVVHDVR